MKTKAVFLDRDGTINEEVNYLYKVKDFQFIRNAPEAIKVFREIGYKIFVVTNQAGIARGFYSEKDVRLLHNHIDTQLKIVGAYIDGYYYCPHHPEGVVSQYSISCSCRKPSIGMIKQIQKAYNVDLKQSIIIGDKESDIKAGKNAGIGRCFLVRSGHLIEADRTIADDIFDDIYDIAKVLKQEVGY